MDESVLRALAKWPDVPAVYGWLFLDRRGEWRLRAGHGEPAVFERIANAAMREFIARNYACDERGRWFFQNGPQRVFVRLAYTPRVWRSDGRHLVDQCGAFAQAPFEAWLDEEGSLIIADSRGAGVLDDRDLQRLAEGIRDARIAIDGQNFALGSIQSSALAQRYGFEPCPRP